MVTKEELNNARIKMLEQKRLLDERRSQQKKQHSISRDDVNDVKKIEAVEVYLSTDKSEKKIRPLLTKTESISILISEAEMIKDLRARITDSKNNFYPSKSDIHRLGISLLKSFKDEEIVDMIKSSKL